MVLLALYTFLSLVLSIISTLAWIHGKAYAESEACLFVNAQVLAPKSTNCGLVGWGLYVFIAFAAGVVANTNSLSMYISLRDSGWIKAPLSPVSSAVLAPHALKAVVFSLLLYTPALWIGWARLNTPSILAVAVPQSTGQPMSSADTVNATRRSDDFLYPGPEMLLSGLNGVFILETAGLGQPISKAAFFLFHIVL
jgi:hypothetical protein